MQTRHNLNSNALDLRNSSTHYGAMKWKRFLHFWPFVRGIHRSQRPMMRRFHVSLAVSLNNVLNKQSSCRLFEMPWFACEGIGMKPVGIIRYDIHFVLLTVRRSGLQPTSSWPRLAKFMGPTLGPLWSCRPQMGPMLVPWTLLSDDICGCLDAI